jgi:hypothetical protein
MALRILGSLGQIVKGLGLVIFACEYHSTSSTLHRQFVRMKATRRPDNKRPSRVFRSGVSDSCFIQPGASDNSLQPRALCRLLGSLPLLELLQIVSPQLDLAPHHWPISLRCDIEIPASSSSVPSLRARAWATLQYTFPKIQA